MTKQICDSCGGGMEVLVLMFPNVKDPINIEGRDPANPDVAICRDCIVNAILESFKDKP